MSNKYQVPSPLSIRWAHERREHELKLIPALAQEAQSAIADYMKENPATGLRYKFRLENDGYKRIVLLSQGRVKSRVWEKAFSKNDGFEAGLTDNLVPLFIEQVLTGYTAEGWETKVTNQDGRSFLIAESAQNSS